MTSAPVIEASQKNAITLDQIPCINYLIQFKKSKVQVQILFDFGSKVNTITSGYALKLGLKIHFILLEHKKLTALLLKYLK